MEPVAHALVVSAKLGSSEMVGAGVNIGSVGSTRLITESVRDVAEADVVTV